MNARIIAREQEIPVLEVETIFQELRDVIAVVEPAVEVDLDFEELDAAVDELTRE